MTSQNDTYLPDALDALLRGHPAACECQPCADLRKGLADIAAAERRAWETSRDVYIS